MTTKVKTIEERDVATKHSATIEESKQIIRKIVNTIATKRYLGKYRNVWIELHGKANYFLGINVRKRKGSGSLLDRYSDDEIIDLEIIAKNWAAKLGYDLEEILKSKHSN